MAFFFRRAAKPAFGPCLTSLPRSPYFRFRSTLGRSLYVHIRRSENHGMAESLLITLRHPELDITVPETILRAC